MKKFLLLVPAIFLLSGCGEVQFPESVATPTPAAVTATPQAVVTTPASTNIEGVTTNATDLAGITKERDNLAEAIKITQDELRDCTIAKNNLESAASSGQKSSADLEKFAPILQNYLTQSEQKQYPFNLCGSLGKATNQPWYASFVAALDAKKIPFTPLNRSLKAADLGGVCASNEGKIAIFLGASSKGKSEFHLIRYNIETNSVESALLLSGSCEDCPTKFGKRFGPVITLTGNGGKEFKYYYDSNIITE
jgi:hypothetical protein